MSPVKAPGHARGAVTFHELVRGWEVAYRDYTAVSDRAMGSLAVTSGTAREMSVASARVAQSWRALGAASGLPWWCVAAVKSAAEAFGDLAHQWESKAAIAEDAERGRRR